MAGAGGDRAADATFQVGVLLVHAAVLMAIDSVVIPGIFSGNSENA